jgi:DNA-binding MarR family transcriptional regulator
VTFSGAELPHQSGFVEHAQQLRDAIAGEMQNDMRRDADAPVRRRQAEKRTRVGAVQNESNGHSVPGGEDVLDLMVKIGEGAIEAPRKSLMSRAIHRRVAAEHRGVVRGAERLVGAAAEPILSLEEPAPQGASVDRCRVGVCHGDRKPYFLYFVNPISYPDVVPKPPRTIAALRIYRNAKLYRSLARILRVYNRLLVTRLRALGFDDFSPAFPAMLSNLDVNGTRIGVLASRAGVTRQGAGQLLREIERCGYAERRESPDDARATMVHFTPRGRRLLAAVLELVEQIEDDFAAALKAGEFEKVREGLFHIAERVDPGGALGEGD